MPARCGLYVITGEIGAAAVVSSVGVAVVGAVVVRVEVVGSEVVGVEVVGVEVVGAEVAGVEVVEVEVVGAEVVGAEVTRTGGIARDAIERSLVVTPSEEVAIVGATGGSNVVAGVSDASDESIQVCTADTAGLAKKTQP